MCIFKYMNTECLRRVENLLTYNLIWRAIKTRRQFMLGKKRGWQMPPSSGSLSKKSVYFKRSLV